MLTLADVPLHEVPVVEPETALDEAKRLMEGDPLKMVVLVGDGMYLGIFNEEAQSSSLLPKGTDPALVAVGPYIHPSRIVGTPDMAVDFALSVMQRRNQATIPLVENRTYRGVVTREDLEDALQAG